MNFLYRSIQFGFMHIWPALVLIMSATIMPSQNLGVIAIVMSVATLFRPIMGLSLGRTVIRAAGVSRASGNERDAEKIINMVVRIGLLASLPCTIIAWFVIERVNGYYHLGLSTYASVSGLAFLAFFGLTEFFDGVLRAQGKFKSLAVSVTVSRFVGIALFLIVLPNWPSFETIFSILAISEFFATLLLLPNVLPAFKRNASLPMISKNAADILLSSMPVIINSISVYFYARAMVMIIGAYDNSESVGGFELALQITNLPMAVTIISATVISPIVAKLYAESELGRDTASRIVSYAASFSVWVNAVAAAFLGIVAPFYIYWLFPDLHVAPIVLAIIAPLVLAKAYAQIISGEISVVTNNAGTAALITIISGIATVIMGVAFSMQYGAIGGAIAMLITHMLSAWATIVFLGKRIKLNIVYKSVSSILTVAITSAITGPIVWGLRSNPAMASLLGSLIFFSVLFSIVVISLKFKLKLHEPLIDGVRMLKSKSINGVEIFYNLSEQVSHELEDGEKFSAGIWRLAELKSPLGCNFWMTGEGDINDVSLQDHVDIIYTAVLLGRGAELSSVAAQAYVDKLVKIPLYGKADNPILAHLTAYLLGGVRLLEQFNKVTTPKELYEGWSIRRLVDNNDLPIWPRAWSHHIWRVSHWIGGSPSILLHLASTGKVSWATTDLVINVLKSCEKRIINKRTGLLKTYKSKILHRMFRLAYSVRHDPDIADIGGVVHLLWVYHAIDRSYVSGENLNKLADIQLERRPFMEDVPYCLDFDVVQLKRTAAIELDYTDKTRAVEFGKDIAKFFRSPISSRYSLHKIPGALATMHEAALINGDDLVVGVGIEPIDIIKRAYWL